MTPRRRLLEIATRSCSVCLRTQQSVSADQGVSTCYSSAFSRRISSSLAPRYFSVQSTRDDPGLDELDDSARELQAMQEEARALVQKIPLGSIDGDTWCSAEEQMRWWARQGTPLSIRVSFLLLERLIAEQSQHTEPTTLTSFLDRKLLDELVLNWHQVCKASLEISSSPPPGVIQPQKLVHELDNLCSQSPTLVLSGKALLKILDITGRQSKRRASVQAAVFAESLLDRMIEMIDGGEASSLPPFQPPTQSLNWVLSTWAACARPDRAHDLLRRVQHLVPLSTVSYNCLLAAYAKLGNGPAVEQVLQDMCQQWESEYEQSDEQDVLLEEFLKPDIVSWNTALSAWAKSSAPDAGARAQALLECMCDPENMSGVQPDLKALNTVLVCLARSKGDDSVDRAREVLQQMEEWHASGDLEEPPDLFSYTTVLNAYAKAGRPQEAQDLFEELYRSFVDGEKQLKPTLTLFNTLLEAWSRAGNLEQTRSLFQILRQAHELGFLDTGPNTATYNIVLTTIFRYHNETVTAASEAESILNEMKNEPSALPDFYSFSMVVQTCLRSPGGIGKAKTLAWEAMDRIREEKTENRPDSMKLKALILAFCKADEAETAEDLLMAIVEKAKNGRLPKPGISLFGAVVSAWERSRLPNAAFRADKLVQMTAALHKTGFISKGPDFLMHKALLSCWIKSPASDSPVQVLSLINKIRETALQTGEKIPLDTPSYNRVLLKLATTDLADEAHQLLRQTICDHVAELSSEEPNGESYNIVLWALSRCQSTHSIEKVENLLRDMKHRGIPLASKAYESVVQNCANVESSETSHSIESLLREFNTQADA